MTLLLKETIARLVKCAVTKTEIDSKSYTPSTSWKKVGDITIPNDGVYLVTATWSSQGNKGIGYSTPSATSPQTILIETTTQGGLKVVSEILAGTYSFYVKSNGSTGTNTLKVFRLVKY